MATVSDFLESYAEVLRRQGTEYWIVCPQCGTRKMKCSVNTRLGVGHCFRASCGYRFNFPKLVHQLLNCPWGEALKVARKYSEDLDDRGTFVKEFDRTGYPAGALPLEDFVPFAYSNPDRSLVHLAEWAVHNLVRNRKLSGEQIKEYQIGVGYCDQVLTVGDQTIKIPRYGMLVVPVIFNGTTVSYLERTLENEQGETVCSLKHYSPREEECYLQKGDILFNCDKAIPLSVERKNLILVEDCWSAIHFNAVALMGTILTEDHLQIILENYPKDLRITVCFDGDSGGQQASGKVYSTLAKYYEDVRIVRTPPGDPTDHFDQVLGLINTAERENHLGLELSRVMKRKSIK